MVIAPSLGHTDERANELWMDIYVFDINRPFLPFYPPSTVQQAGFPYSELLTVVMMEFCQGMKSKKQCC